jgi:transposase
MKYEKIKKYKEAKFRRITGVKRKTFEIMLEIVKTAYDAKHKKRGMHTKLSIEDMLLATLEYLREYRSYAHIAASYDIDESNIYRGIKWVEEVLIRSGRFRLPGKGVLLNGEIEIELKDVTECPIERPKKNE